MFVLADTPTFRWPVRVRVPGDQQHDDAGFVARFRVLSVTRLTDAGLPARELMREALIGWDGVIDEHGTPVPFGEAARDALLELPYVVAALAEAYAEALAGGAERKN